MNKYLSTVREAKDSSTTPDESLRRLAEAKARIIKNLWDQFPGKNLEGVASFATRDGSTHIGHIEIKHDQDGPLGVEVWLGPKSGEPNFFLVNPPLMVPDPTGSEILTSTDPGTGRQIVERFRVDPLQAVAEVIGSSNRSEQG